MKLITVATRNHTGLNGHSGLRRMSAFHPLTTLVGSSTSRLIEPRRAEACSRSTFIISAMLPWVDKPMHLEEKGHFEGVGLHESGFRTECSVRSISPLGAILKGQIAATPGATVAVELATGQRHPATIAWVRDSSLGVGFKQPIDVLALIKRKLVSQPIERREMPRVELRCSAWLKDGEDFVAATVRNISSRGLQLEGEILPCAGAELRIFVEGLNVPPGEVVWRRDNLAGVRMRQELSWRLIMPWLRDLVRNQAH